MERTHLSTSHFLKPPKHKHAKKRRFTSPPKTQAQKTYECQKILDMVIIQGQRFYLIKWKGFSDQENTWEPLQNLRNIPFDLIKFQKQNRTKIEKEDKMGTFQFQNSQSSPHLTKGQLQSLERIASILNEGERNISDSNVIWEKQMSSLGDEPCQVQKTKQIKKIYRKKGLNIPTTLVQERKDIPLVNEKKERQEFIAVMKEEESYFQSGEGEEDDVFDYQEYALSADSLESVLKEEPSDSQDCQDLYEPDPEGSLSPKERSKAQNIQLKFPQKQILSEISSKILPNQQWELNMPNLLDFEQNKRKIDTFQKRLIVPWSSHEKQEKYHHHKFRPYQVFPKLLSFADLKLIANITVNRFGVINGEGVYDVKADHCHKYVCPELLKYCFPKAVFEFLHSKN